jgi:hypothetical protein
MSHWMDAGPLCPLSLEHALLLHCIVWHIAYVGTAEVDHECMSVAVLMLLQAAAAAGSLLGERLAAFKVSLLSELESGLLGTWGSQLKAAAAAEAAQQVDAGLQVRETSMRLMYVTCM